MGFVMAGLGQSDYDRQYSDITLLRRIFRYFTPYKLSILIIGSAIGLSSIAGALVPLFISNTLDTLNNGINFSTINLLLLIILVFTILNFTMNAITQILTARTVQNAVVDLRNTAFNSLLDRDMSFFDKEPTGRLASRVVNDTNSFGQVISLTVNLLGQIILVFFVVSILIDISVKLTIVLLIFAPTVILVALAFRKIARNVSLGSQRILAKVNALIQETTSGIYIAKSFRAEEVLYDEFDKLNLKSYDINIKRGLVFNSIFPILSMLTGLGTAMIVYYGGLSILDSNNFLSNIISRFPGQELTIGQWFLFLQGLNLFFFPLISIASFWAQFQQGLAASERVFSLIDAENEVIQYDDKILEKPKGMINFENVTFGYEKENLVLENFNLKINSGEKIAIVGHTGAGKSTIANLIQRYYEFQDGKISIDNQNIRSLDLINYRKQLSIISQDVFLWNATIRENLLYGIPKTDNIEDKLNLVLKDVQALSWIEQLPNGLDTRVGERGQSLSMGQRQLIAFARILLRDPAILIMDEATASLDPFSDLLVQKATNKILEGRTSIVIAHRLSTIKNADRIIVLSDGKILEEGTHEDLLTKKGHYADLYDTYYRHQSLEYIENFA
ncbi:MAG: ABC transporter ATP-binding protein [Candidatus Kariarchaeum pelagius]|jgi:ATP-binding cassette subfamily B protein|nr:ABC transporter [Candidatus Heimdallarchaeota archaeon]